MSTSTYPDGIRELPSGRWQVRYQARSFGTYDTEALAIIARAQIQVQLQAGRRPRKATRIDLTLHDAASAYLRRRDLDRQAGAIRESTFVDLQRCVHAWVAGTKATAVDEDGYPFAGESLSTLEVVPVMDWYDLRSVGARTQARKELDALKAVLKDAGLRGATFQAGLLAIPPKPKRPRPGVALTMDELDLLAACFPERLQSLPVFLSTVGLRISEALTLTRDRCRDGQVFIPAHLTKEGRDKRIGLLPEEADLLAQQLSLITNSEYVWPRPRGGMWQTHRKFWGKVWHPAVQLAGDVHDVTCGTRGRFDTLRPHDLRHTAATWMRRAQVPHELVAARLGHADEGALVARVYNHPDPDDLAATLHRIAGHGIRAGMANVVPIRAAS